MRGRPADRLVRLAATTAGVAAGVAGQPSPVEAARWFAGHGGVGDLPPDGWHDVGRDETGALVRSGNLTLHAIQGADLTWLVDSGKRC